MQGEVETLRVDKSPKPQPAGLTAKDLGFRVYCFVFRISGWGVKDLGFRVKYLESRA